MGASVLVCGAVFDGVAEELSGPTEILVRTAASPPPGTCADIVAMPGDPFSDITATTRVDFVVRGGTIARRPSDC